MDAELQHAARLTQENGDCVATYARSDIQVIGAVPGCDQQHARPVDNRTGLPALIWCLECPPHEAWIMGAGRPKVLVWEPDGNGGFHQRRIAQMEPTWARSIEDIPLTPDQARFEVRRNSLTRRAEQGMLQQGLASIAAAYDHQPVTRELLRARQFSGKATAACHSCYAEFVATAAFCPECGVRVPAMTIRGEAAPVSQPAEA